MTKYDWWIHLFSICLIVKEFLLKLHSYILISVIFNNVKPKSFLTLMEEKVILRTIFSQIILARYIKLYFYKSQMVKLFFPPISFEETRMSASWVYWVTSVEMLLLQYSIWYVQSGPQGWGWWALRHTWSHSETLEPRIKTSTSIKRSLLNRVIHCLRIYHYKIQDK